VTRSPRKTRATAGDGLLPRGTLSSADSAPSGVRNEVRTETLANGTILETFVGVGREPAKPAAARPWGSLASGFAGTAAAPAAASPAASKPDQNDRWSRFNDESRP
jgi:hypothetical protein